MSIRVGVGDAVLVQVNDKSHSQRIGLVEYIGYLSGQKKRKYVGINLVDKIENGHDGSIHGVQRFKCRSGHGIYVGIKDVIKKLGASELTIHMQQIVTVTMNMQQRLDEYVKALEQRDEYIETLKDTARRLRKQLNAISNRNLHTIKELAPPPPPVDKSMVKKDIFCKQKLKKLNFERIQKHSEYTKYKESPKRGDVSSSSEEWTDDTEGDDEDDLDWVDDDYHDLSVDKNRSRPTPISVSLSRSKQKSFSSYYTPISMRSYQSKSQRKSHSTHNTPVSRSSSPYHISISPYDSNMQIMYDQIMLQQQQQQQHMANASPHLQSVTFMHHAQQVMASGKRSNSLGCYDDVDAPLSIRDRQHGLRLQRSLPCPDQLHIPSCAAHTSFDPVPHTQSMAAKGFRSTPCDPVSRTSEHIQQDKTMNSSVSIPPPRQNKRILVHKHEGEASNSDSEHCKVITKEKKEKEMVMIDPMFQKGNDRESGMNEKDRKHPVKSIQHKLLQSLRCRVNTLSLIRSESVDEYNEMDHCMTVYPTDNNTHYKKTMPTQQKDNNGNDKSDNHGHKSGGGWSNGDSGSASGFNGSEQGDDDDDDNKESKSDTQEHHDEDKNADDETDRFIRFLADHVECDDMKLREALELSTFSDTCVKTVFAEIQKMHDQKIRISIIRQSMRNKEEQKKSKIQHPSPSVLRFNSSQIKSQYHMIPSFTAKEIPSKIIGIPAIDSGLDLGGHMARDYVLKSLAINENNCYANAEDTMRIFNFGLHLKQSKQDAYFVTKRRSRKGSVVWSVDEILTETEICSKYCDIDLNDLRDPNRIDTSYEIKQVEEEIMKLKASQSNILQDTKWNKIPIYNKENHKRRMQLMYSIDEFKAHCKQSMTRTDDNEIEVFPIVMFGRNDSVCVQYAMIVSIEEDADIVISFKYDISDADSPLRVAGIHLDKDLLYKQHQVACTSHPCRHLSHFKSSINYMHIGNCDDALNGKKGLQRQLRNLNETNKNLLEANNELLMKLSPTSLSTPSVSTETVAPICFHSPVSNCGSSTPLSMYSFSDASNLQPTPIDIQSPVPLIMTPINREQSIRNNKRHHVMDPVSLVDGFPDITQSKVCGAQPNKSILSYNSLYKTPRITMAKHLTGTVIPGCIKERIVDVYDFINKSKAICFCNRLVARLGSDSMVLNCGFHDPITNDVLYLVATKQFKSNVYMMHDALYTKRGLFNSYGLQEHGLPRSCFDYNHNNEKPIHVIKQINEMFQMDHRSVKWHKLPIFRRTKNKEYNKKRLTFSIAKHEFIAAITPRNALIPIIMFNRDGYRTEYIKIMRICDGIDIGVSYVYNECKDCFQATAIHLNKDNLLRQHQLADPYHDCGCLDGFESMIDDLHIGNPDDDKNRVKDLQKRNDMLRRRMSCPG
eukprot:885992_1